MFELSETSEKDVGQMWERRGKQKSKKWKIRVKESERNGKKYEKVGHSGKEVG